MKFKKKKLAALALAGVLACSGLAGCSLTTTDSTRDLVQVIAKVDISKSDSFGTGGEFSEYADAIETSEILKRELIASFASYGQTYVNSYGYTVEDTYDLIKDSLVNRQIYLQYARIYFFRNGFVYLDENGNERTQKFTMEGYNAAVSSADEKDKEIAGIRYFLTDEEIAAAEYNLKVTLNNTLDSQEHEVIEGNHTHSHDEETTTTSDRTTPTGVDTVNEDFYDPAYKIYTGSNSLSDCGSYEAQEESTPATRKKAYKTFLANLSIYGLIEKGENTSDITSLSYYALERKTQYESALINKLGEAFEREAEKQLTEEWILKKLETTLKAQRTKFSGSDETALTSALDDVSESNYVFYAPDAYGFVINILLPFSAAQSQDLSDALADMGDTKGNKFVARAALLKNLKATDQRGAWFDADYAFKAGEDDIVFGGGEGDKYLFFENNLKHSTPVADGTQAQYEKIKNYLGSYAYNGSVSVKEEDGEKEYSLKPRKINIDEFLTEMENYLSFAGLHLTEKYTTPGYFEQTVSDFYDAKGDIDYSKFLYFSAKVEELSTFDVNKIFVAGSNENTAMSVINELSFAYNTDTAGLNTYLGYKVSPNKTDYVNEFEYAAQVAVKMGAGSITVAPSEYGWHIMYCTFSYAENPKPYTFNWAERDQEGTFSNLYYEALKADNFSAFSSDRQTEIINSFDSDACVTVYKERYSDRY